MYNKDIKDIDVSLHFDLNRFHVCCTSGDNFYGKAAYVKTIRLLQFGIRHCYQQISEIDAKDSQIREEIDIITDGKALE